MYFSSSLNNFAGGLPSQLILHLRSCEPIASASPEWWLQTQTANKAVSSLHGQKSHPEGYEGLTGKGWPARRSAAHQTSVSSPEGDAEPAIQSWRKLARQDSKLSCYIQQRSSSQRDMSKTSSMIPPK